jgi:5-methylcytosine-specific restriction endonuclease McrA
MHDAHALSSRLATLLRDEQRAMGDFLVALADFDAKKLWRDLGHASLFSYLRRDLKLSAGAAQYRKTAAELIQAFPAVEAALRSGELCLSTVAEVAKVVTPENIRDVLPRFFRLSRKEAEALAAAIRPNPKPPVRDVVTTLPAPAAVSATEPVRPGELNAVEPRSGEAVASASSRPETSAVSATPPVRQPDAARPLDAGTARLHATVSRRFLAKLEAARDALSHAKPNASTEELLEAGLDLLLAERAKRNGIVEKPRKVSRPAKSDVVPAHVKRAVWERAGGRCEFRLHSGGVCGSTTRLELDHVVPRAHGGPSTIDNVRLCCRGHNDLAARRMFGDAWMDRFRRPAPAST